MHSHRPTRSFALLLTQQVKALPEDSMTRHTQPWTMLSLNTLAAGMTLEFIMRMRS